MGQYLQNLSKSLFIDIPGLLEKHRLISIIILKKEQSQATSEIVLHKNLIEIVIQIKKTEMIISRLFLLLT